MRKHILSITIFSLFYTISCAESYKLISFDGTVKDVNVMLDHIDHKLTISSLKDTLQFKDFMHLNDDIKVINNNFLRINYVVISGSNQTRVYTSLICINKNILCLSANFLTEAQSDIDNSYVKELDQLSMSSSSVFRAKLNFLGYNKTNYKLELDLRMEKEVGTIKTSTEKRATLEFNSKLNIFYNKYENISGNFLVYDADKQKTSRQSISGQFYAIILERHKYYYIAGAWYGMGENHYLYKYSCPSGAGLG